MAVIRKAATLAPVAASLLGCDGENRHEDALAARDPGPGAAGGRAGAGRGGESAGLRRRTRRPVGRPARLRPRGARPAGGDAGRGRMARRRRRPARADARRARRARVRAARRRGLVPRSSPGQGPRRPLVPPRVAGVAGRGRLRGAAVDASPVRLVPDGSRRWRGVVAPYDEAVHLLPARDPAPRRHARRRAAQSRTRLRLAARRARPEARRRCGDTHRRPGSRSLARPITTPEATC
jgi:hypothetical protein